VHQTQNLIYPAFIPSLVSILIESKGFDSKICNQFIDLEAFCFFPLSLPNNLQKVIKCADHFAINPYVTVDLSNNQIKNLGCFNEKLNNFVNVRFLDLRNNQVKTHCIFLAAIQDLIF
jgi:hypothetical protein